MKYNKSMLQCSVVTSLSDLQELAPQWQQLCDELTDIESSFISPKWIEMWINQFWQANWQPLIIVGFVDSKLEAIAPFYVQNLSWLAPVRRLHMLGQGEPELAEICSEYQDIIVSDVYADEFLRSLCPIIRSESIDIIRFKAIFSDSRANALLNRLSTSHQVVETFRFMVDKANWSTQSLSKNTRSRWRRAKNQWQKANAEFLWVSSSEFDHYWYHLVKLHKKRWEKAGKKGAFSEPAFIDFHTKLQHEHKSLKAKMAAIKIGDEIVAVNYYYTSDEFLYFYQSGWDTCTFSNLSPGLSLHLWAIQQSPKKYYDFMMSQSSDSYKKQFACTRIPMINITTFLSFRSFGYRLWAQFGPKIQSTLRRKETKR